MKTMKTTNAPKTTKAMKLELTRETVKNLGVKSGVHAGGSTKLSFTYNASCGGSCAAMCRI